MPALSIAHPTRQLLHKAPPKAREHLDRLQARRAGEARSLADAHDPTDPQALVISTDNAPRGVLEQYQVMAAACASWGASVAGAHVGAWTGEAGVAATFGIATTVFATYDMGLTFHSVRKARAQNQLFRQMLAAQFRLNHELNTRLRQGDDPLLRAALGVGRFNRDVLERLLNGHEKAWLSPRKQALAARRRPLELEHLLSADQALRLKKEALAHPHDPVRQASAAHAAQRRDELARRIAELEASPPLPLAQQWREALDHPIDTLSDEQLVLLRDGYLQAAKLPFDAANHIGTLVATVPELARLLQEVCGILGLVALPLSFTHLLDIWGGDRLRKKAHRGKLAVFKSFAALAALHAQGELDPGADPAMRAVRGRVCLNLMHFMALRHGVMHCLGLLGRFRGLKGLVGAANLPLVVTGLALVLAGVSSLGTAPGAAISALVGVPFMVALAGFLGLQYDDDRLARRQQRQARRFVREHGPAAIDDLYAGRRFDGDTAMTPRRLKALRDNTCLSIEWLAWQLHTVATQAEDTGLCHAERLLLALGQDPDALKALRQASRVQAPGKHLRNARAVVVERLGFKPFPDEDEPAEDSAVDATAERHAPVPLLPGLTSVRGPAAGLQHLETTIKAFDGLDPQRYPTRALRWLRRFGPHRFATPRRIVKAWERLDSHGPAEEREALPRSLLVLLLNQLPQRPDGRGIAWPEGYEGDTGDCLARLLEALACGHENGAMDLTIEQRRDWRSRRLARRLEWDARLARRLLASVQAERAQSDRTGESPWWDEVVDPPVFLNADEEAERAEASAVGPTPWQAPAPLPAYAIRV
jgi:hypothetical protein